MTNQSKNNIEEPIYVDMVNGISDCDLKYIMNNVSNKCLGFTNSKGVIDSTKGEHLIEPGKNMIRVGFYNHNDIEKGHGYEDVTKLVKGSDNIDWNYMCLANDKKVFSSFVMVDEHGFCISQINGNSKYSKGYMNCYNLTVTGVDKRTGKIVSFISHQDPIFFLSEEKFTQDCGSIIKKKDYFSQELGISLRNMKNRCEPGTIDAVILGGHDGENGKFFESIDTINNLVKKEFNFSPSVIGGPTINSDVASCLKDILLDGLNIHYFKKFSEFNTLDNNIYSVDEMVNNLKNNVSKIYPLKIIDLLSAGEELNRNGRLNEANIIYNEVLKISPENFNANIYKGNNLRLLGRFNDAIVLLEDFIKLRPDMCNPFNILGEIYFTLGNYNRALLNGRKSFALKNNNMYIYGFIGKCLMKIGKKDLGEIYLSIVDNNFNEVSLDNNSKYKKEEYFINFFLSNCKILLLKKYILALENNDLSRIYTIRGITLEEKNNYFRALKEYDRGFLKGGNYNDMNLYRFLFYKYKLFDKMGYKNLSGVYEFAYILCNEDKDAVNFDDPNGLNYDKCKVKKLIGLYKIEELVKYLIELDKREIFKMKAI